MVARHRLADLSDRSTNGGTKLELLQGMLDLLVLQSLSLGPLHGLGVSDRIAQITKGAFRVKPGSLFPALHRLEEAGWLKSSAQNTTA